MAVFAPDVYHLGMATQDDYIKTALRLPRDLHSRLLHSAEAKGRSLNAELIDRLQGEDAPSALVEVIARQNAQIAERDLELHAQRLEITGLASTLRLASKLILNNAQWTKEDLTKFSRSASDLIKHIPESVDDLLEDGEKKMKQFVDANEKFSSIIKQSHWPLSEAESTRAVKRILRTPLKKTAK